MTDNEIIKAYEDKVNLIGSMTSVYLDESDGLNLYEVMLSVLDLVNRQKAENERLKEEVSKTRRKALLEASSKFAGHSDYHGDTILCKLICMAEGKEVKSARPLDKAKIKAEAYKEFAEIIVSDYPEMEYYLDELRKDSLGGNE